MKGRYAMYIGNIGDRLDIQVEVTGVYKYEKPAFNGWEWIDTYVCRYV